MTGTLIVAGLVAAFVLLDQLLLAAERRGWVHWRRSPPSSASAGTALLEIMAIYEPSHHHIVEERRATDSDEAEDDDPLDPLRRARSPEPPSPT